MAWLQGKGPAPRPADSGQGEGPRLPRPGCGAGGETQRARWPGASRSAPARPGGPRPREAGRATRRARRPWRFLTCGPPQDFQKLVQLLFDGFEPIVVREPSRTGSWALSQLPRSWTTTASVTSPGRRTFNFASSMSFQYSFGEGCDRGRNDPGQRRTGRDERRDAESWNRRSTGGNNHRLGVLGQHGAKRGRRQGEAPSGQPIPQPRLGTGKPARKGSFGNAEPTRRVPRDSPSSSHSKMAARCRSGRRASSSSRTACSSLASGLVWWFNGSHRSQPFLPRFLAGSREPEHRARPAGRRHGASSPTVPAARSPPPSSPAPETWPEMHLRPRLGCPVLAGTHPVPSLHAARPVPRTPPPRLRFGRRRNARAAPHRRAARRPRTGRACSDVSILLAMDAPAMQHSPGPR